MGETKIPDPQRTVLITGCSDGGLGAALAVAFHNAGLKVYATARNPTKMQHLKSLGIETLPLDVLSESSIASCVAKLASLDILVNNAGAVYNMPASDLSIPEARKLFDLNVWSYVAVMQAFLPLLLKSKGMIVNQTSIASVTVIPFQSAYTASKAAMAMISNSMRLELAPFGIKVVDLKTGMVNSNIIDNHNNTLQGLLPRGSLYEPARKEVEGSMRGEQFKGEGMEASEWAKLVIRDLLKKSPPPIVWRGKQAWLTWFSTLLPFGTMDNMLRKLTGLDVVETTTRK